MKLRFQNPRSVVMRLQKYTLTVNVAGKKYVEVADTGRLAKGRTLQNGEEIVLGDQQSLPNVHIGGAITELEPGQSNEGWLQFIFKELVLDDLKNVPLALSIIDAAGEQHHAECVAEWP